MTSETAPSWLRWPPNCCETCVSWRPESTYVGRCEDQSSTHAGNATDSRSRCHDFSRKPDKPASPSFEEAL